MDRNKYNYYYKFIIVNIKIFVMQYIIFTELPVNPTIRTAPQT